MKRIVLFCFVLFMAVCANAQWKIGKLVRSLPDYDINMKSKYVPYLENANGTLSILEYREDAWAELGKYPSNCLVFTGFYTAVISDPTDSYVNIRKGAGTNYPVVGKVSVGDEIIFKKTNSNWYQVYGSVPASEKSSDGYLLGVGSERGTTNLDYCAKYFLGYIYQDRVVNNGYWELLEF